MAPTWAGPGLFLTKIGLSFFKTYLKLTFNSLQKVFERNRDFEINGLAISGEIRDVKTLLLTALDDILLLPVSTIGPQFFSKVTSPIISMNFSNLSLLSTLPTEIIAC